MFHLYQIMQRLDAGVALSLCVSVLIAPWPVLGSRLSGLVCRSGLSVGVTSPRRGQLSTVTRFSGTDFRILPDPVGENANDIDSADPPPPATWVPPMGASRLTWHNISEWLGLEEVGTVMTAASTIR